MTAAQEQGPDHGTLELVLPDGRRFQAKLDRELDLKDPGRFLWPTHMALVSLARQATGHEEGPMDMPSMVGSLVEAEHSQRIIAATYRGMLVAAHGLLADLGAPQDDRHLKAADRLARESEKKVSGLYARFRDLMHNPQGRVWSRKENG